MKTISIKNEFKDDYITREAGERLRKIVVDGLREDGKIELDFSDLIVGSTSFFDEGIAKLVEEGWTAQEISSRVVISNINPRDFEVLLNMGSLRGAALFPPS